MANRAVPALVGGIAVLAGAGLFFLTRAGSPPPAPVAVAEVPAPVVKVEVPQPTPVAVDSEAPAMDPEAQPRTTYVADFTSGLPKGFVAENVVETEAGIVLGDAPPGPDGVRRGVVSSPDVVADFPLNSIAPLWKEKLADGTRVSIEISLSSDGVAWGPWMPLEADAENTSEISPTFPDGRPNPNYGFTASMRTTFTEDLWGAFRYRFTLVSANASTPTLGGVRLYYQDSTMGEGRPGDVRSIAQKLAK